jgi:hypothetical protein
MMTSGWANPVAVPALARPSTTTEVPGAMRSSPGTSSLGRTAAGPGLAGASMFRYRQASRMPVAQNGTFTQNMNRQLRWVRMAPPISGPRIADGAEGLDLVAGRTGWYVHADNLVI